MVWWVEELKIHTLTHSHRQRHTHDFYMPRLILTLDKKIKAIFKTWTRQHVVAPQLKIFKDDLREEEMAEKRYARYLGVCGVGRRCVGGVNIYWFCLFSALLPVSEHGKASFLRTPPPHSHSMWFTLLTQGHPCDPGLTHQSIPETWPQDCFLNAGKTLTSVKRLESATFIKIAGVACRLKCDLEQSAASCNHEGEALWQCWRRRHYGGRWNRHLGREINIC